MPVLSNERQKAVESDGRRGDEDLRGETVIRIYYLGKKSIFNKVKIGRKKKLAWEGFRKPWNRC